jgi:UDP-4-amino-4,6-dideoxy-N-acetyl-beta-L-altrosamine transaminase
MIPYGRQDINQDDINSIIEVLKSDFLTQGPQVPLFEKAIANYCDAKSAVAVNSATSALHIACLALDVGPGDDVWTSPNTFVSTANCALYCGANIDFVDIDPVTYNLSASCLEEKLIQAEKHGQLPKVVIPVHFAGQSCDMVKIHELSVQYGFNIIEDASHAVGGRYCGEPIGTCRYSDITVFSFHPVKIITAGEGGMALTNTPSLANKMKLLRSHNITNNIAEIHNRPSEEIWNYQQTGLGFNYRMSDIHAALGLSQTGRLDQFVAKRHAIAQRYNQLLTELPLIKPKQIESSFSSFHLYVIRLKLNEIYKSQRQVFTAIHERGVLVNLHYIPVYLHPYYQNRGFKRGYCPEAEAYFSECISIPIFPTLTKEQQDYIFLVLKTTTKR